MCCFSSTGPSERPPPLACLSVRFFFAQTFAVNCLCFLSFFHLPDHHHSLSVFLFITCCCPLHLCLFIPSSVLSAARISLTPPPHPHPPRPVLCCGAHRSDQDRWSQMISGLYSFLRETAWYCCWHDAFTGCPQVQRCPNSVHFKALTNSSQSHFSNCH